MAKKRRVSTVSKLLNARKKTEVRRKKNTVKAKTTPLTLFGSNVNGILGKREILIIQIYFKQGYSLNCSLSSSIDFDFVLLIRLNLTSLGLVIDLKEK